MNKSVAPTNQKIEFKIKGLFKQVDYVSTYLTNLSEIKKNIIDLNFNVTLNLGNTYINHFENYEYFFI